MNLKIHTYPDGRADHLDPYDQILLVNEQGKFVIQQAGEGLRDGDQYAIPPQSELPPRQASDVMYYFASNQMTHDWEVNLDGDVEAVNIWSKNSARLVTHPFSEDLNLTLLGAIEYVMDQDEI
jgi:hypothetical protein|tara:strand:+ start:82 stop:450 length:369 start_codon:yes stop_codon:yes gene_type:complete